MPYSKLHSTLPEVRTPKPPPFCYWTSYIGQIFIDFFGQVKGSSNAAENSTFGYHIEKLRGVKVYISKWF